MSVQGLTIAKLPDFLMPDRHIAARWTQHSKVDVTRAMSVAPAKNREDFDGTK